MQYCLFFFFAACFATEIWNRGTVAFKQKEIVFAVSCEVASTLSDVLNYLKWSSSSADADESGGVARGTRGREARCSFRKRAVNSLGW